MSEALLGVVIGGVIGLVGSIITVLIQGLLGNNKERRDKVDLTIEDMIAKAAEFHLYTLKAHETDGTYQYHRLATKYLKANPQSESKGDTTAVFHHEQALREMAEHNEWINRLNNSRVELQRLSFRLRRVLPARADEIATQVKSLIYFKTVMDFPKIVSDEKGLKTLYKAIYTKADALQIELGKKVMEFEKFLLKIKVD